MKDVVEFKQNHHIICQSRYPEIGCNDHYLGETDCKISKRVLDHSGRDQNSHLFKQSIECRHPVLDINNYKIIDKRILENRKFLKHF